MPIVFGALVAAIGRLFATQLGRWIAAAMLWLGIGFATQAAVAGPGIEYFQSILTGGSGVAVDWMAFLMFDKALTMVLSAYATRATISAGKVFLARRAAT